MGEIIISILIGSCLIVPGIVMILTLKNEEKKTEKEND